MLDKLARLEKQTDDIIPCVLQAGGEVVLEHVQRNLQSSLSGTSTGELERALGVSPAGIDRRGNWNVKVGFDEPRSDSLSNAMLANILEHGKHNQPARPFLKPAKSAARGPAIDAMKRAMEKEVEDL